MYCLGIAAQIFIHSLLLALTYHTTLAADLKLNWKNTSTNESGFKIERRIGTIYVEIAIVEPGTQSYTDSGLNTGVTYCYRVRSFNPAGTSVSNTACATALNSTTVKAGTDSASVASAASQNPWTDYRVAMKIRSGGTGAVGVMFRYLDGDNYYRFELNGAQNARRLQKRVGGVFQILAQDSFPYTADRSYFLEIALRGSLLEVRIDRQVIFFAVDATFRRGTIALYSSGNEESVFDDVLVTDLNGNKTLIDEQFEGDDYAGWTMIDEGTQFTPSQWTVANGALVQKSKISGPAPANLGTYALYTKRPWTDYRLSLKMRSNDNAVLGVMFRFQDSNNFYRFSWDQERRLRRLAKREKGSFKILAEDAVPYSSGLLYQVELVAHGTELNVVVNGSTVFSVDDLAFNGGTIALYSSRNQGSVFDDVLVEDLATGKQLLWADFNNRSLLGWTVIDEAADSESSDWRVVNGQLVQNSHIGSATGGDRGTFILY